MTARRAQFVKVKCPDCSNEQVAFNRPASVIACLVCGATLANPVGGEATFKGEVTARFE